MERITRRDALATPTVDVEPISAADLIVIPASDLMPEGTALVLLKAVLTIETGQPLDRDRLLDAYAECLQAAKGDREARGPAAVLSLVH